MLNTYFPTDWALAHLDTFAESIRYLETLGKEGRVCSPAFVNYTWGLSTVDHVLWAYLCERGFIRNGFASGVPTWVYELPTNPYALKGGK